MSRQTARRPQHPMERMRMASRLIDAMRDAVDIAGGRVSEEAYLDSVKSLIEADGGTTAADSLKTNAFNRNRMEKAGITRVTLGQGATARKEVWNEATAEATFGGTAAAPTIDGGTVSTNIAAPSMNESGEEGCWFGIPRRNTDDFTEAAHGFMVDSPTGFVESDAKEMMRLATAFSVGYHVMLEGPKGCGKTMSVLEMGYRLNIPVVRFNCSEGITEEDFIGYRDIVDGNTIWVDGLAAMAAREGCLLYPDETNGARANIMLALNQMMDTGRLVLPTGEVIVCHDDFRVIGSMNPPDDYTGVNEMNQATRDRFAVSVLFTYLDETTEVRVIQQQSGVSNSGMALQLVRLANDLRRLKDDGTISTDTSTRMLIQVMTLSAHWSIAEAVRYSMLGKYPSEERDDVEMAARARLTDYS